MLDDDICVWVCFSRAQRRVKEQRVFIRSIKCCMKRETTRRVPPSCHCESQTRRRMTGGFECRDRLSKHTQESEHAHAHVYAHRPANMYAHRHRGTQITLTQTSLTFQPLHIKGDHRLPATDMRSIHQELLSTVTRPMPVAWMEVCVEMCHQTFSKMSGFNFLC